jgi:anaerobic magnesium-protoporphyrin IX monomethyl ester cyclase
VSSVGKSKFQDTNPSIEKNVKILLATPIATTDELWGQYAKGAGHYLPLGLLSIAGVCREAGFDVQLLDASTLGINEPELRDFLLENRFDVIGLGSCYTALAHLVFRMAVICRSVLPASKIIIGGVHPTLFPFETLQACPSADFVCHGQGERTFLELVRILEDGRTEFVNIQGLTYRENGQIYVNEKRPHIVDPENLPMLPFDLLQMDKYVPPPSNYLRLPTYGLLATQGCPYKCVYCDTRVHGSKLRNYGTKKLIQTIQHLVQQYSMKGLLFHDSVFTLDRSFVEELCKQLINNNLDISWSCFTRVDRVNFDMLALMKRAGCWSISYGLESGNPESLRLIRKNTTIEQAEQAVAWTKNAGIQVIGSFILCLPGEDELMTLQTIEFARRLKLDTAVFFLPVPFPGTELYDLCKADGGLAQNITWEQYRQWMDPVNPLYVNPKIGKERMVELYDYAVRSFYTSPATIFRALTKIHSPADMKKYLKGFRSIAGVLLRSLTKHYAK